MEREGTEEIFLEARALSAKLAACEYYQNYLKYQKQVFADDALKARLFALKGRQLALEARRVCGEPVGEEEEKSVSDEYFTLMMDERCAGFMESERLVSQLLSELFETLSAACPLDLSYLDTVE